jgi:hypothetical protein
MSIDKGLERRRLSGIQHSMRHLVAAICEADTPQMVGRTNLASVVLDLWPFFPIIVL